MMSSAGILSVSRTITLKGEVWMLDYFSRSPRRTGRRSPPGETANEQLVRVVISFIEAAARMHEPFCELAPFEALLDVWPRYTANSAHFSAERRTLICCAVFSLCSGLVTKAGPLTLRASRAPPAQSTSERSLPAAAWRGIP